MRGNSFLYLAAYSDGSTDKRSAGFNISVHPPLCNARHVFRRWPTLGTEVPSAGGHIHGAAIIIAFGTAGISRMSEHFRLGVVMDPIDAIKYAKDSTLA